MLLELEDNNEPVVLLRLLSFAWQKATEEERAGEQCQALRAIALRLQEAGVET